MIRPLKEEDIKTIIEDEERIFGESLGYLMLHNTISGEDPLNHFFVDEEDSKIRGYIGVWFDEKNSMILNFYVKEEYRRMHIGENLMRYVIDYVFNSGVDTITLEVRPHNLDAIDLYRKLGFEYSYKRKYYYNDGEDAHIYILYKEML